MAGTKRRTYTVDLEPTEVFERLVREGRVELTTHGGAIVIVRCGLSAVDMLTVIAQAVARGLQERK